MDRIRRTHSIKSVALRPWALRLGHAFGIHLPVVALALREGQTTPTIRCLICGRPETHS